VVFLDAAMIRGIDLVLQYSGAENHIRDCDAVITGEGKIDAQTLQGKLIDGISSLTKKYNKKLIAICGRSELSASALLENGIAESFSIQNENMSLKEAMENAGELLYEISEKAGLYLKEWV
jgi:glycerate kinase